MRIVGTVFGHYFFSSFLVANHDDWDGYAVASFSAALNSFRLAMISGTS